MSVARRARSSEQKIERRHELLQAARALFERRSFHEITMAEVARRAHLAKGTLFLYFRTKEELFFAVALQEFERWLDDMDGLFRQLAETRPRPTQPTVLASLRGVLQQHVMLTRLIAILHSVLEHNVRYPEALRFKRMMGRRLPETGALIEQTLRFLRPGQGVRLLIWMYALVIGFAHVAEPAPVIQQVYRNEPELRWMQLRFGETYFDALATILDGWRRQNAGRCRRPGEVSRR